MVPLMQELEDIRTHVFQLCRENRKDVYSTPRDAFIRPMVDLQGARARLRPNSQKAAAEIEDEFDENRWESQEALKYMGGPSLTYIS